MNGIDGVLGLRSASAERNSGRIGSINAVCEATSMFTRRANRSRALTATITSSTFATAPATTVCRGERNPATLTSG